MHAARGIGRDAQQTKPQFTQSSKHLPLRFNLHILPVTTADYVPLLNTVQLYKKREREKSFRPE